MKLKQLVTAFVVGLVTVSLAACGSQSASSKQSSKESTSSSVSKKGSSSHRDQKVNTKKNNLVSASGNQESTITNGGGNMSSNNTAKQGVVSQSASNGASSQATSVGLSETDARNLVKERLGANLNNAKSSSLDQPSASDIDGFVAQKSPNGWILTGTHNGQRISYNVTPNSITQR